MRHETSLRSPVGLGGPEQPALPVRLLGVRPIREHLPAPLGISCSSLKRGKPFLLLGSRRRNQWILVPEVPNHALLLDIVEVREKLVVLLLRERIEFVIVATGAAERETEPHGSGSLGAVGNVLYAKLLVNRTPFGGRAMVPIESGGDDLVASGVRKHVPSQLLDREPVESQIAVEGIDHPVAPAPHRARAVCLVPVGIGVASCVEPHRREVFAVPRGSEQAIQIPLVGIRRRVRNERLDSAPSGRQTGQVQRGAPSQDSAVRGGSQIQALASQLLQHKRIDRIPRLLAIAQLGCLRSQRRHERPVPLPFRALLDPAAQDADFVPLEGVVAEISRGHALSRIDARNARDELALVGRAGSHGPSARGQLGDRSALGVQPQARLPLAFVRPVAAIATVGQNGPHVVVVVDSFRDARLAHDRCEAEASKQYRTQLRHVVIVSAVNQSARE